MHGGTRFRMWMQRAGAGVLSKDEIDGLAARFLLEASKDCAGDRVYIPSVTSENTHNLRVAMRLADHGLSFADCKRILGEELPASTFYRWRRERCDKTAVADMALKGHKWRYDFVYALGFVGADDERAIKIGMSSNLRSRVRHVAKHCPMMLERAAVLCMGTPRFPYSDAMHGEREAHAMAAAHRLNNEWFALPGGIDEAADILERVGDKLCEDYRLVVA